MGAARKLETLEKPSSQQLRSMGAEASLTKGQITQLDDQTNRQLFSTAQSAGRMDGLYLRWMMLISELYRRFNLDFIKTFWVEGVLKERVPFSVTIPKVTLNFLWDQEPRVMLINDKKLLVVEKVLKIDFKGRVSSIALIPIFSKEGKAISCLLLGDSDLYRYDPRREVDLLEEFSTMITKTILKDM